MTLRDMRQIVGGLCFVGLAVLIARIAWSARRGARPVYRQAVHQVLLYAVVVSFLPGLTRRDVWPFSAWSMMADPGPDRTQHIVAYGVTAGGVEVPIDHRVWEPVMWAELSTWIFKELPGLPAVDRDRAGAYMLDKANAGWRRFVETGKVGTLDRWLGPFAAPEHMLAANLWRAGAPQPAGPFIGLRIVWERWNTDDRYHPAAVERETIYATPEVR